MKKSKIRKLIESYIIKCFQIDLEYQEKFKKLMESGLVSSQETNEKYVWDISKKLFKNLDKSK
jgi:hypothetical protein